MVEPKVYTIAPGLPLVDALAAGLRLRLGEAPEAMADARIFLPTRRACRALTMAFVRQSNGRPLLLPRMTPLGDIDDDDLAFTEIEALNGADLPPAVPALRRQLLLAREVARVLGSAIAPAQAALLAAEMARLFDQVHTEQLDLAGLDRLAPDELAGHWQITLRFLRPLAARWQEMLEAEGCLDPADRRNRLLASQAAAWRAAPPSAPVIAAGSTGSVPATAALLAVIARLPQGAVVLPGLDQTADEATWRAIAPEPGDPDHALAQSHPQFGLAMLLRRLGVERAQVQPWPAPGVTGTTPLRAATASRALAPATCAERAFGGAPVPAAALDGVSLLEATSPEEEARSIALIMRQTLEDPTLTAALVTPDRALGRRVAAELERWGIAVDDSGGQPLAQTVPATFLRLVARMIVLDLAPVPLLAALKHPLAAAGSAPVAFRNQVRALERLVLRGLRPAPGVVGLRRALAAAPAAEGRAPQRRSAEALIDTLETMITPLASLSGAGAVNLGEMLAAHVAVAEALAATADQGGPSRLWAGDAGEALAGFVFDVTEAGAGHPPIAFGDYPELLDVLMAGRVVRPRWGRHPRLAIWGPLEARLQRADVMILGSLNEDSWPPKAPASPWMSRPMMQAFGLPLPERRIGLSAHDFCQAFSSPRVWLTRARRAEGAPTVPCRWLLRLQALMHGSGWSADSAREARQIVAWQRLLDAPGPIVPMPPPAPTPPLIARPRHLSVTRIETWIRDPYAIYARDILRLRLLDELDAEPEAADFGTFVHAALAAFVADEAAGAGDDVDRLFDLGRKALGELFERPGVRTFWWPRFEQMARWFVETHRARRYTISESAVEISGTMAIATSGGIFRLTGKADRIDRLACGGLAIIDYKTGRMPREKDVQIGLAPQLPLEAAIAEAGGFATFGELPVVAMEYWHLRGDGNDCQQPVKEVDGLADRTFEKLRELIETFDDPSTPYLSRPRPHLAPPFSDYQHLARVKEWALGEEAED